MDNDVSGAQHARTAGSDASALGFLALGLTLLAFGLYNTDIISDARAADAAGLALFVGGITQFLAGMWEFRLGSALTGTAFAGLGAFFATWSTLADAKTSSAAAGLFLLIWALLALTLTAAAWRSGLVARAVFGLSFAGLLLLSIADFAETSTLVKAGGWVAAVAGAAAWYGATASLTNSAWGRGVLPLGR